MTVPNINGRNLLYNLSKRDPEKCRQAIMEFRKYAVMPEQKPDADGLKKLRYELALKLSRALFTPNENEVGSCMRFLGDKLKNKPKGDSIEPLCWKKLFDKIVAHEPDQQMKSQAEKQQKRVQKDCAQLTRTWHENEDKINKVLTVHNREIAKLDFKLLAAEIDSKASQVSDFKGRLRQWAHSNQPATRLQELFKIPKFTNDFIAWQKELIKELADTYEQKPMEFPKSAIKTQVRLLTQKLKAAVTEIIPYKTAQDGVKAILIRLSLQPLPQEAIQATPIELTRFEAAVLQYDTFCPKCEGAKDRLLGRDHDQPPAALQHTKK